MPAPLTSCCQTGGGIGYGISRSTTPASRICSPTLPEIGDPLTSRRGVGHAVGTDARRARGAGRDHGARPARACRSSGRAQRRSSTWLRRPNVLDVSGHSGPAMPPRRQLERLLRAGTRSCDDGQPEVGVVLGAARDTAAQPAGSRVARASLEKDGSMVPGLPLAEPDYIYARAGARRPRSTGVAGNPRQQLTRTRESSTARPASQFVRPRSPPISRARRRVLRDLKDVSNRRREPWVLEGLAYLHHPLRRRSVRSTSP